VSTALAFAAAENGRRGPLTERASHVSTVGNWAPWSIAALVLFPVLVIVTGELIYRLDKRTDDGEVSRFVTPLAIIRTGVLPLAFIDIALRQIVGLESAHLAVKIADTAFGIVALNAAVALLNVLVFRDGSRVAGRFRIPRLLLDLSRLFFVLCGAAIVVSKVWDVDLSSLLTALGVGSIVIGLALQDTLGSLVAGIAMISARQFRVGDWIRTGKDEGLVLEMNWRAVKIRTRSGDAMYVPNGSIARDTVTVMAAGSGSTSVSVELTFTNDRSPDQVIAALVEAARVTGGLHRDPKPVPRVLAIEDGNIRYTVPVRVLDPQTLSAVRSEFLANVWFIAQRRGLHFGESSSSTASPQARPIADPPGADALVRMLVELGTFRASVDALQRLVRGARVDRYRAGQSIIEQNEVADRALVLMSGRVSAVYGHAGQPDVALHEYERGQLLIAKSLLQGTSMPYAFRAVDEVEAMAIPVDAFRELCTSEPGLARDIEQVLSSRAEAAVRALAAVHPDQAQAIGLSDRVQLMREMFRT
jgi:small-conductance mechanosensitive channel/CRP-like cAMP-binding protein